jgi:2,3-dihydroxyphenylpropionate 1,2-dioxygenase
MSTIVAGLCMSHNTGLNIMMDRTQDLASAERWSAAIGRTRAVLEAAHPDVLVIAGSNHFMGVYLDMVPSFTLGVGEVTGDGDERTPEGPLPVDTELARRLAFGLVEREFDLGMSLRLTIDHGITYPMQYLTPALDVPVVPIVINAFTPPLPTINRVTAFGAAVREIIESDGQDKRVAIIGAGGISHYLPFFLKWWQVTEEDRFMVDALFSGRDAEQTQKWDRQRGAIMSKTEPRVREDFDREIIRMVTERDWSAIAGLSSDKIEELGGNGAQEVRNWVFAAAATGEGRGELIDYVPMHEWHTGLAAATLRA